MRLMRREKLVFARRRAWSPMIRQAGAPCAPISRSRVRGLRPRPGMTTIFAAVPRVHRHCEARRAEAIQDSLKIPDCFVASLLAMTTISCRRSPAKPAAIVLRRGGEDTPEAAAHGLLRPEAAALRDTLYRQPRLRQQPPRCLDPQPLDRAQRRLPGGPGIMPAERALAHAGLARQPRQRQIVSKVFADPIMQRAELIVGGLQRQRLTEL